MSRSSKIIYNLPVDYTELHYSKRKEVRQQYIKEQDGKCFYCGEDLNKEPPIVIIEKDINWNLFPPNFLKSPIHLQHCHKTGMTEGAVHAYCNAVLWQYEHR